MTLPRGPRLWQVTRNRLQMDRALDVVRAHALAQLLQGAPRLDPHTFNLRYFPFLGTYQCRSLYARARAALGVRWPA